MTASTFEIEDKFKYFHGFNGFHQSEAAEGAIPSVINIPQKSKYGLYTERISGSSFTVPRKDSKQTWLYRLLPSTNHEEFSLIESHPFNLNHAHDSKFQYSPSPSTWAPVRIAKEADFLTGLQMIGGAGNPTLKEGLTYYFFTAGKSMPPNQAFYSADGDFLLAPQKGSLDVRTEMGYLRVRTNEICVIPRGIRFHVSLPTGPVRGFALELFEGHFELPELGSIGSTGLANIRDFEIPTASYDNSDLDTEIIAKFAGQLHRTIHRGSIFNVAGWQGTYYPFKYDLGKFNTIGSVSYDHPDPSIFTVLTCASSVPGEAVVDVAVFGPRWLVMEKSYRPPYFHRNTMSEFAFLIQGGFDVTPLPPQLAGLFSLNNTMVAHGADPESWKQATEKVLQPQKIPPGNLGVMFESRYIIGLSEAANKTLVKLPGKVAVLGEFEKAKI
ncbi:uncharacterized protein N7458_003910 [Penicillium daleae]|uniref:homogentisate 1,2-dioxygenase n=1 Tax=Penicillium daleae TaxID=63821 RepID=A0AAD6G4H1_9EURO|nr:uncharacterized protein N7458_003910 [Penicillium daleae]KAJ5455646.1 hypothetical protein N7458_003910 [Penicillium daleae]